MYGNVFWLKVEAYLASTGFGEAKVCYLIYRRGDVMVLESSSRSAALFLISCNVCANLVHSSNLGDAICWKRKEKLFNYILTIVKGQNERFKETYVTQVSVTY
jgi:hypothetical protein